MKASQLIGHKMAHTTATDIAGEVTDILFDMSLREVAFYLADITTPAGIAPVLFSPSVLVLDDGVLKISAHPDDIAARHDVSLHRQKVALDVGDLPSTFVGPFGNTFSPAMIAAMFNARTDVGRPTPPMTGDGLWFTELKGRALRAHVGDVGHIKDVIFDDHFTLCEGIEIATFEGQSLVTPAANIRSERGPDDALLLSIIHSDISS